MTAMIASTTISHDVHAGQRSMGDSDSVFPHRSTNVTTDSTITVASRSAAALESRSSCRVDELRCDPALGAVGRVADVAPGPPIRLDVVAQQLQLPVIGQALEPRPGPRDVTERAHVTAT